MTTSADDHGLVEAAAQRDPYPAYARLRADAPIHFSPHWKGWLITRYADVATAFRHPGLSANRMGGYAKVLPPALLEAVSPLIRNLSAWILMMDPPAQTRIRGLISSAFTPRFIDGLRPRIAAIVDHLLGDAERAEGPTFDAIAGLAYPLPVMVIADMLGLPHHDHARLKHWSDALATFLGVAALDPAVVGKAVRAIVEMEAYFREAIAARRAQPTDDLISALVAAHDAGGRLDEQELVSTCCALLFGGHETTTNLIGNAIHLLLTHPTELARLRQDPSLLDGAVEEVLRHEAPVQRMGRVSATDVEIGGATIPAGGRVYLVMGAAHRDAAQFPDPDRFDIARKDNRHLAFGLGNHFCLGAALGRMEARLAVGELLRRFPDLAPGGEAPAWIDNLTIRGLERLPVRLRG